MHAPVEVQPTCMLLGRMGQRSDRCGGKMLKTALTKWRVFVNTAGHQPPPVRRPFAAAESFQFDLFRHGRVFIPTRQDQFYVLWTCGPWSARALSRGGEAQATMPRRRSKIPRRRPRRLPSEPVPHRKGIQYSRNSIRHQPYHKEFLVVGIPGSAICRENTSPL